MTNASATSERRPRFYRALSAACSALLVSAGLIASGSAAAAAEPVSTASDLREGMRCGQADACDLVLAGDITAALLEVFPGKTVTVDLAGYELEAVADGFDDGGIKVSGSATLVVEDSVGTGVLTATGSDNAAGIGSDSSRAAGTITLNGGTIVAVGNGDAAGIGGGADGNGSNLEIGPGADVTASSDSGVALGAGLGGEEFGSLSNAGTLTIPADNVAAITAEATVTNSGTITGEGTIANDGAIVNTGTVDLGSLSVTGHHYRVSFDANGGEGAPAPLALFATSLEGGGISLPTTEPTRPGHGFTGWYTSSSGDGQPVTEQTEISTGSATGNPLPITLYAGWDEAGASQTTVASGTNPAMDTDDVSLTATVDPVPDGGTVAFVDRNTVIDECAAVPVDASGTAICEPGALDAGRYVVTADFSGTAEVAASTSDRLLQAVYSTRTGHVVAWGSNGHDDYLDQDGLANQSIVPDDLGNAIAVAGGTAHSLALLPDGTVVGWGSDLVGEATPPSGLAGVVAIAAGSHLSVALKADGTVVAWGRDDFGQVTVPEGLTDVVAIAAGDFHVLALKSDGSVVVWGSNEQGQHAVPTGLFATQISGGTFHSYAVTPDGTVVGWGDFNSGQLSPPDGLDPAAQVEAGGQWSMALTGGSLVAWGRDDRGQTDVPDLSDAVEISAGWYHGVARVDGGTVVAWGDDSAGQLGVPDGLDRVYAIDAGGGHTLALNWTPPVINIGTTTTVESSVNPSEADQQVRFTADVAPNPGGGTVTFTDGATTLCADVPVGPGTGEATCTQTFTTGGSHSITAEFPGFEQYLASTSEALTQVVNAPVDAPEISTTSLPAGTVGTPYTASLAASGGTLPFDWTYSGDLPAGLQLSGNTITGVPSAPGTSTFTVMVTDSNLQTDSQELSITIEPAPFSQENSTVTAAPESVTADGTTAATVTVTVVDTAGEPMSGETIDLAAGTGSSTIYEPSGVSDDAGQVTFTVTDTVAEQVTYTAAVDGVTLTDTADVTFTAGPVSAENSTVTAEPTSLPADGTSVATITVTLLDANENPVADRLVTLTGTGSSTIDEDVQTTSSDGQVVYAVTNTVAEQVTYTATVDGLALVETATVSFTAGEVSAATSTVTAAPASVTADGASASTITVTVLDANGNPLAGADVSLAAGGGSSAISEASGPADAAGVVTFTVTDTVAEQVAYTASVGEIEIVRTATVTFTAGDISASVSTVTASPTSVVADGESTSTITVTVLDANDNPVVGEPVSLVADGGSSEVSGPSGVSDAGGVVTFTVTDTVAERVSYTATAGQTELTQTAGVTFTAGPVSASDSTLTAAPSAAVADGESASTITVTLLDANENPVAGQGVTLAADGGSSEISEPSGVSDAAGKVTFTVTNTVAERVTYTAAAGDEIDQTATVTFTPGAVSVTESTVTAEPSTVVADGESASTITGVLLDAQGNPVPSQKVSLVADGGSSVIAPAQATSAADGTVTFTVTDTTAEEVTYSAQVSTVVANAQVRLLADADLTLDATATVTFIAGEVSASDSTLTAAPATVLADGTSTSTITATLLDAQGNSVADEEVSLTASGGSSAIAEATGISAADGTVTFEVTNDVAEQVTYRASVGELELETGVTVTFVSAPSAPLNPAASAGDAQVELTWDAPADDGESPVLGYQIYRSTETGERGTLLTTDGPVEATSYTDSTVENRTTYDYEITAVNAIGEGPAAVPVKVRPFAPLTVTTQELPDGQEGLAYSAELGATGGPVADYTWTLVAGDLPPGLELSADGMITGTPTRAGEYAVTIGVNNPAQADLVITITPADVPPPDAEEESPADSGDPSEPEAPAAEADLPATGSSPGAPLGLAALSVLAGLALVLLAVRSLGRGRRLQG